MQHLYNLNLAIYLKVLSDSLTTTGAPTAKVTTSRLLPSTVFLPEGIIF